MSGLENEISFFLPKLGLENNEFMFNLLRYFVKKEQIEIRQWTIQHTFT